MLTDFSITRVQDGHRPISTHNLQTDANR